MTDNGHVHTEFAVRWHMELGSPLIRQRGTRGSAEASLSEPPVGSVSGELIQRMVSISPWTLVPDAAAAVALFAQPEHDYNLPGFPRELVKATADHEGVRYTYLGEDGERLVILGHPDRAALDALWRHLVAGDPDYEPDYEPEETYARLLWECPDHKPGARSDDCLLCQGIEPGEWWLDWKVGENEKPNANADKAGYFPVVVWEVDV